MEATRAMLHDLGLSKFLWGEVANIVVYVQNKYPHQALNLKTPEEVFTNVEVSHYVTFDEDIAFGKAIELPIPRKENDDATGKQDEPSSDEPMPDVEGSMDPIDPPLGDPSTSRKIIFGHKDTLEDIEKHISPREFVKHKLWKDAMNEEYESIIKNDVWDVVPRPKDKFVVTSKWIYKIKHGADGSAKKHKARLVAQGFCQKEGVDYDEIFAPAS
eukprot:PITA_26597